MSAFHSTIGVLQTLVIALGAGLAIGGAINLLTNPGEMRRVHKEASTNNSLIDSQQDVQFSQGT